MDSTRRRAPVISAILQAILQANKAFASIYISFFPFHRSASSARTLLIIKKNCVSGCKCDQSEAGMLSDTFGCGSALKIAYMDLKRLRFSFDSTSLRSQSATKLLRRSRLVFTAAMIPRNEQKWRQQSAGNLVFFSPFLLRSFIAASFLIKPDKRRELNLRRPRLSRLLSPRPASCICFVLGFFFGSPLSL